jgi:hypothetical protein
MLWSIVYHKFLLHAGGFEMIDKFFTKIFATTVGVKDFDMGIMLSSAPGFKILIGRESLAFVTKEMVIGKSCFIIPEAYIIAVSSQGCDGCRTL